MASGYGCKGGTGATAGKRAEVLRSPSTGMTKRVFKGQRWLVIAQMDEGDSTHIWAYPSYERAQRASIGCFGLGYEVHYVEKAELVA